MRPLLDTELTKAPAPPADFEAPLQLKVSKLDYNDYTCRMAISRISGGGELHLAILAEPMRGEGFEFQLARPQVILRRDGKGALFEPIEYLVLDLEEAYMGRVMEMLGPRRVELADMAGAGTGRVR